MSARDLLRAAARRRTAAATSPSVVSEPTHLVTYASTVSLTSSGAATLPVGRPVPIGTLVYVVAGAGGSTAEPLVADSRDNVWQTTVPAQSISAPATTTRIAWTVLTTAWVATDTITVVRSVDSGSLVWHAFTTSGATGAIGAVIPPGAGASNDPTLGNVESDAGALIVAAFTSGNNAGLTLVPRNSFTTSADGVSTGGTNPRHLWALHRATVAATNAVPAADMSLALGWSGAAIELLATNAGPVTPPTEPPPPTGGTLRQWSGDGLTAGTLTTTSGDTNDNPFTGVSGTWTIVPGTPTRITTPAGVLSRLVSWGSLTSQDYGLRYGYRRSALPTAEVSLATLRGAVGAQSLAIRLSPTGTVIIRDNASVSVGQSATGVFAADTDYTIEVGYDRDSNHRVRMTPAGATAATVDITTAGGTWIDVVNVQIGSSSDATGDVTVWEVTLTDNAALSTVTKPPATTTAITIGPTVTSIGDPDTSQVLNENSGLVTSRRNGTTSNRVFWGHNDSGGLPEVYAFDDAAPFTIIATYGITGFSNGDWEDIALGPGPDSTKDYLHVGNIGAATANARIHRFVEPTVTVNQSPVNVTLASTAVDTFTFVRPANLGDCEGVFVDPVSKDIFLFQKRNTTTRPATASVYRITAAQLGAGSREVTLELVGTITTHQDTVNNGGITGADISEDGRYFAVCNYEEIFAWTRDPAKTIAQTITAAPAGNAYRRYVPGSSDTWGSESLTFDRGTSPARIYTMGEGANASLKYVPFTITTATVGGSVVPALIGFYGGNVGSTNDPGETFRTEYGSGTIYPKVESAYYLDDSGTGASNIKVSLEQRRVDRGTIPLWTVRAHSGGAPMPWTYPQIISGAADAWLIRYRDEMRQVIGEKWVAFEHEFEVKQNHAQKALTQSYDAARTRTTSPFIGTETQYADAVAAGTETPSNPSPSFAFHQIPTVAQYAQAANRVRSIWQHPTTGVPGLKWVYWYGYSRQAVIDEIGALLTPPDIIALDPYVFSHHSATTTFRQMGQPKLDWQRSRSWYQGQPIIYAETAKDRVHGDSNLASTFYDDLPEDMRALGIQAIVLFLREKPGDIMADLSGTKSPLAKEALRASVSRAAL